MQIRSPAASPNPAPIGSRDNPQVKALRALISQPRVRRERRQCWVEGSRLVEAFLSQKSLGWQAHLLVWAATAGKGPQGNQGPDATQSRLIAQAQSAGAQVLALDAAIFAYLSGVEAPQGIGLVASQARQRGQMDEERPTGADILVLDGLQDPGNMGSMIRTAAAAGVGEVLLTEGSTEAFSPKALRAGAGAQFLLPVREGLSSELLAKDLIARGYTVALTLPPGAPGVADLYSPEVAQRLKSSAPIAWVLGQEGQGVSSVWQELGQSLRITIRHDPQVESLNVTAAAAVVLFERLRCRR
jgi:TrmH family RNA methyltransferase